ncbi:hypothetical protein ACJMK2_009765 [Sinanodonta woodiana]|uniref:Uncharacterized protein n=1 Tax=Sinanodonta woodiana TaxID=1069815 RepID=A0ABD3VD84_SINWO
MRPKLSCYGGHVVIIYLLYNIAKAQAFTCDKHSVKGTFKCDSRECCTSQLNYVIKADITGTNHLCGFGIWYFIEDKLPGQKCVYLSVFCEVELSYCYTEGTSHTLPPNVSSDNQSTTVVGIETSSSPGDENVTIAQHDNASVVSVSIDIPATESTRKAQNSNTQTSFNDGVIIGVLVVAVFLVIICVSIFLYIRHQRKRRKPSSTSPFKTSMIFTNAEHAQPTSYGNSHERNDSIGSTTLVQHGVADATIYYNSDQRDSSFKNGEIIKSVPIEASDYANVQYACLMEDGDRDQRNPVELDEAYDHTNNTDDKNTYDSTYQERISFEDNYSRTIPFHDREDDTYECT